MTMRRKDSVIIGVLFLLGFAGAPGAAILGPILQSPDLFSAIYANENTVYTGFLLQMIMAFACAGIGIRLYPVLKEAGGVSAVAVAGFRLVEAAFQLGGGAALLLMVAVSRHIAGTAEPAMGANDLAIAAFSNFMQTLAVAFAGAYHLARDAASTPAWLFGAIIYYRVFYKTGLVPKWLAGWGLAGAISAIAATLLTLVGQLAPFSPAQVAMMIPIALQEIALAMWLIVVGFGETSKAQANSASF